MRRSTMRILLTALIGISLTIPPATAGVLTLDPEYTISLKEKDRVLGSLRGNYLVYGRPNITMYNTRGNPIFSRKLKNNVKPSLSPNGKYLALVTYADRNPTDLKTVKLEIFDRAGRFQWKMDDPPPQTFHISNIGNIFGIEGVKGIPPTRIYLYNRHGTRQNILVFDEFHGIQISPSGGRFIVDKAMGGLEVYDTTGNFLYGLPVSGMYVFDKDEQYIGTYYGGVFRLFQNEKEVARIATRLLSLRGMAIDVEENMLVLMGPKNLEVYEIVAENLVWDHPLLDQTHWYSSLDLAAGARHIACGIDVSGGNQVPKEDRHVEGYLLIFPRNGENSIRHHETYDLWGIGLPKGVFTPSGGAVIMQTREKITKFKLR